MYAGRLESLLIIPASFCLRVQPLVSRNCDYSTIEDANRDRAFFPSRSLLFADGRWLVSSFSQAL